MSNISPTIRLLTRLSLLLSLAWVARAANSSFSIDGDYDATDVIVPPKNPAGINLGAALMAIAAARRNWYKPRIERSEDGKSCSILVQAHDDISKEQNIMVKIGDLSKGYSSVEGHRWPDAYAKALLEAGWPPNPDGSLATIKVELALQAITGKQGRRYAHENFSYGVAGFGRYNFMPFLGEGDPIVLGTKSQTTTPGLKPKYSYAVLQATRTHVWLGDPAQERKEDLVFYIPDIFNDIDVLYDFGAGKGL